MSHHRQRDDEWHFEIVIHDMPREQALRDVDQLRDFYTAGWLKLMGLNPYLF